MIVSLSFLGFQSLHDPGQKKRGGGGSASHKKAWGPAKTVDTENIK